MTSPWLHVVKSTRWPNFCLSIAFLCLKWEQWHLLVSLRNCEHNHPWWKSQQHPTQMLSSENTKCFPFQANPVHVCVDPFWTWWLKREAVKFQATGRGKQVGSTQVQIAREVPHSYATKSNTCFSRYPAFRHQLLGKLRKVVFILQEQLSH